MPKSLIEELTEASPNRRSFLKKLGAATAAVGAISVVGERSADAQTSTEVQVLQFALNLEYLESEFYTYAQYGYGIENFGIGVSGLANSPNPTGGGTTTGGAKIPISNDLVFTLETLNQIGADERAHVTLLRSALGSNAIAKPNINLAASGPVTNQSQFLAMGRMLEDTGLSAYIGSANLLSTPTIIFTAARIVGTEGEHVSTIRTQIARLNVATTAMDGADILPPPSGSSTTILSVNPSDGLPAARLPGEVLYIAYGFASNASSGGFFPDGVNGPITMSTGPAPASNLGPGLPS